MVYKIFHHTISFALPCPLASRDGPPSLRREGGADMKTRHPPMDALTKYDIEGEERSFAALIYQVDLYIPEICLVDKIVHQLQSGLEH